MLIGHYDGVLDSKNRVFVPARLREEMDGNGHLTLYVTRGLDGCLFLAILALPASAQNLVLDLDGREAHAALPTGLLDGAQAVTVECWVRWERFGLFSQPFGCGTVGSWTAMWSHSTTG